MISKELSHEFDSSTEVHTLIGDVHISFLAHDELNYDRRTFTAET